jgi:hypothetical protein
MNDAMIFDELKGMRFELGLMQKRLDQYGDIDNLDQASAKIAEAISFINDEIEKEPV